MYKGIFEDYFDKNANSTDVNEQDIRTRDSYPKIKALYDKIILDYLKELRNYPYKIMDINEYQKVIVFDCGHVTYFAIEPELIPTYYEDNELYKLCSDYNIVFADLIMSSDFNFQEGIFMQKYEWWSKLFDYCEMYPNWVLDFKDGDDFRCRNTKGKKYFDYVNKQLPELKLKERYTNHQKEALSFEKNKTYKEGLKLFKELFKSFKKDYLSDYTYEVLDKSDYEKIIIVEKDYILFFYMTGHSDKLYDGVLNKAVSKEHLKILSASNYKNDCIEYRFIIQELTYNSLFSFNRTEFYKKHKKYITYIDFDYANLKKDYFNNDIIWLNRFKEIDEEYPDLKLQDRYDNWEGIQYYYIVYELTCDDTTGFGVTRTTNSLPTSMAKTFIKEYEHYKMRSYNAFSFDDNWFKCMDKLLADAKKSSWENVKTNNLGQHSLLAEKVKYYIVPIMLKDTSLKSLISMQEEVLNNATNNKYKNLERYVYDVVDYKWKSEELMYECVKKVFKGKKVIHQYRPYYLGHLSYDVFVCGLDIAFEYQGQQHFEPIEIFGGKENFKKQQERDAEKMERSKKNGVVLIYVNYWEDVTKELIEKKYREAIDNTKREDD